MYEESTIYQGENYVIILLCRHLGFQQVLAGVKEMKLLRYVPVEDYKTLYLNIYLLAILVRIGYSN
jgi:hypothetical protein